MSIVRVESKKKKMSDNSDKKEFTKEFDFLTHKSYMVILKSVCARVCVCDMGKKGKGLRKQSWDALVTFPFFFLFSSSIWAWN